MFRSRKISRLADLLDDPMVDLVMKSDGVDRRSLELLFESVRHRPPRDAAGLDAAFVMPVVC